MAAKAPASQKLIQRPRRVLHQKIRSHEASGYSNNPVKLLLDVRMSEPAPACIQGNMTCSVQHDCFDPSVHVPVTYRQGKRLVSRIPSIRTPPPTPPPPCLKLLHVGSLHVHVVFFGIHMARSARNARTSSTSTRVSA